jgi:NADH dehydrogenase [ubiquinone] 1 alpha subcomplex assembly factor 5
LADTTRHFDRALVLGAHSGLVAPMLANSGKVGAVVSSDASPAMTARGRGMRVVGDEEALPFADAAFDLIVSPLVLHWVNDLPGALVQGRRCLRPDGLFLAALLGGDTLQELREATLVAESEVTGGAAPRVAPFAAVRELGGLLQRAGLALSVADSDRLTVRYRDPFALMNEIRAMGGANAPASGPVRPMRRDVLRRTAEVYAERFCDPDGRIRATFEIVYLTGWAPHESQPRPLAPGSARTRLADALGTVERTTGDKADPPRR